MPTHRETRLFPYTPDQVFNLVADVQCYPEFLPWCVACRIVSVASPTEITADLVVGFKMVREQFTSRVVLKPYEAISVEYVSGPFEYMTNEWKFTKTSTGTRVDFYLSFEFRSKILQKIIGVLFEEAVSRMVASFEARATQLYSKAT